MTRFYERVQRNQSRDLRTATPTTPDVEEVVASARRFRRKERSDTVDSVSMLEMNSYAGSREYLLKYHKLQSGVKLVEKALSSASVTANVVPVKSSEEPVYTRPVAEDQYMKYNENPHNDSLLIQIPGEDDAPSSEEVSPVEHITLGSIRSHISTAEKKIGRPRHREDREESSSGEQSVATSLTSTSTSNKTDSDSTEREESEEIAQLKNRIAELEAENRRLRNNSEKRPSGRTRGFSKLLSKPVDVNSPPSPLNKDVNSADPLVLCENALTLLAAQHHDFVDAKGDVATAAQIYPHVLASSKWRSKRSETALSKVNVLVEDALKMLETIRSDKQLKLSRSAQGKFNSAISRVEALKLELQRWFRDDSRISGSQQVVMKKIGDTLVKLHASQSTDIQALKDELTKSWNMVDRMTNRVSEAVNQITGPDLSYMKIRRRDSLLSSSPNYKPPETTDSPHETGMDIEVDLKHVRRSLQSCLRQVIFNLASLQQDSEDASNIFRKVRRREDTRRGNSKIECLVKELVDLVGVDDESISPRESKAPQKSPNSEQVWWRALVNIERERVANLSRVRSGSITSMVAANATIESDGVFTRRKSFVSGTSPPAQIHSARDRRPSLYKEEIPAGSLSSRDPRVTHVTHVERGRDHRNPPPQISVERENAATTVDKQLKPSPPAVRRPALGIVRKHASNPEMAKGNGASRTSRHSRFELIQKSKVDGKLLKREMKYVPKASTSSSGEPESVDPAKPRKTNSKGQSVNFSPSTPLSGDLDTDFRSWYRRVRSEASLPH